MLEGEFYLFMNWGNVLIGAVVLQLSQTFHPSRSLVSEFADRHAVVRRSSRVRLPISTLYSRIMLIKISHSFEEQQIEQPTGSRALSKSQVAYMSPRLGVLNTIPFSIPFEICVSIFRHFVANDMMNRGMDRHRRTGRTRVLVRRGNVAQDGFDKLEGADLKALIEISFIDQLQEVSFVSSFAAATRLIPSEMQSWCRQWRGIQGVLHTDRGLWLANKKNKLYPNPHSCHTMWVLISHFVLADAY